MEFENYPELTEDQQTATSIMIGFIQEVFKATDPLRLVSKIEEFSDDKKAMIAQLIDTAKVVIETHWEVETDEGTESRTEGPGN